jgi:2-hydroxychromene-2-carboxylate isomerase
MVIDFHFDFGSPNAYLAHKAIRKLTANADVAFEYVPVLLGGVFKATGNVSPAVSLRGIRNKPEYQAIETRRFCAAYGIEPYRVNPHFPVNTLAIMRGAVFAQATDYFERYVDAIYEAMWEQALKMDDDAVIDQALTAAALPTAEIRAGITDLAVKQRLIENTECSVARGTFGSPTFFVGDEIFFGKDKLRDAIETAHLR